VRVRRWLAPALFLVVAVLAGVLAVRAPAPVLTSSSAARPARPVLSARRVPEALSSFVADARLGARLDTFLADASLAGGRDRSCLVVQQGGRAVYARQPHELLTPASNLKLATASAALTRLGQTTTMETAVFARRPNNGVVAGDLWVVGGGDPLLATKPYADSFANQPQLHTPYEDLAAKVVAAGVHEIQGRVMGDDSRYDAQRYLPSWKRAYITEGHVGPESALAVNDGFQAFSPRKVVSTEPPVTAAAIFTDLLRAQGVVVTGEPGAGKAPGGLASIASVRSPPVKDIVGEMLRESDNNTAELLVKELGRRFANAGTTAAGLGVVGDSLARAKLPSAELKAIDGSGLDRSDLATCNLFAQILATTGYDGPITAGLAVAGETGTLADRFDHNPAAGRLRGKTGFLDGVVALSGWMDGTRGGELLFSFLANGLPIPTEKPGYGAQERLGAILAGYPESPAAAELQP
jgi:D-alanyl-D-alanine carboxypeptidase/D-alanyl-D-alanine-endopeptidase (penicillin-binding protein 4)